MLVVPQLVHGAVPPHKIASVRVLDYHLDIDLPGHRDGFHSLQDAAGLPDQADADVPHLPAPDDPHPADPWGTR